MICSSKYDLILVLEVVPFFQSAECELAYILKEVHRDKLEQQADKTDSNSKLDDNEEKLQSRRCEHRGARTVMN